MEFNLYSEQSTPNFTIKMFGEEEVRRWESGGAFGSAWSERKRYVGVLMIETRITRREEYFLFNTSGVKDGKLPPFGANSIFGIDETLSKFEIAQLLEIACIKVSSEAVWKKGQPFRFIEIDKEFITPKPEHSEPVDINHAERFRDDSF